MKKETAVEIYTLALSAIENLAKILQVEESYQEYKDIKKGVGLSIGKIQMDILEIINEKYPELDHLKDK